MSLSGSATRITIWATPAAVAVTCLLLAADKRAIVVAVNTLLLSAVAAGAGVVLGAPLAFLLVRTDIAGRRLATICLLTLLFTPLYLQAAAWLAGFGPQGWFIGVTGTMPLVSGWGGAIAIHSLAAIPWVVVIVGVGLRLAEPELEEEALLCAGPGQVFLRVTLPRALTALNVAFLWVAITTAAEMTITDLFQIRTYAETIYTDFALGDDQPGTRTVPGVIVIAWAIVGGLLMAQHLAPVDRLASQRHRLVFRLGRWHFWASGLTLAACGLLVGIPVISLLAKAGGVVARQDGSLVRSWSFEHCGAMIAQSPIRFSREFGWSFVIGILAATAALAVGLPLAWSARHGGRRAVPAIVVIGIGLALPGPLIGIGLIACFSTFDWPWLTALYDHSIAAVWIAQTVRALPLCTLVLWYAMASVSPEILDSAALDGAGSMTRLFRIAVPQRLPAIAAAWLVALAIAWGELAASVLVVPPGVMTLPIQIFNLIHYGVDDRVAGVSLTVVALFAIVATASLFARARGNR